MKTKLLKIVLLITLLPLFSFLGVHKFYISVTNVDYSQKDQSVQIITRIFVDDLNQVIEERYGVSAKLGTKEESANDLMYFEKYLRSKFLVEINGTQAEYDFIGKKYDADMVICYLEVPKVALEELKQVGVQNEILTDLFDEQQNVVHFKVNGSKKSFVLLKSEPKGMLNL